MNGNLVVRHNDDKLAELVGLGNIGAIVKLDAGGAVAKSLVQHRAVNDFG